MNTDRASRFQVLFVPCTYEIERAQLESNLTDGQITKEEFGVLLSSLDSHYDRGQKK